MQAGQAGRSRRRRRAGAARHAPPAPSTPARPTPTADEGGGAPAADSTPAHRHGRRRAGRPRRPPSRAGAPAAPRRRPRSRPPSPRRARGGEAAPAPAPASGSARRARRRPRPRHVRLPRRAKRHGSSTALVIPIRGPTTGSTSSQPARRARSGSGPRRGRSPLWSSPIAERLGQLARARAEVLDPLERRAGRASRRCRRSARARGSAPPRRRPRARRPRSAARGCRRSGRRRRGPGGPNSVVGARREADVGVAGRLGVVVGLGLDDHARRVAVATTQPSRSARPSTTGRS